MIENDRDAVEKKVRHMLGGATVQAASCIAFLGLGIKFSIFHGIQHGLHGGRLSDDLKDFVLFTLSALNAGLAVHLCGKAWMLMAGFNPEKGKP